MSREAYIRASIAVAALELFSRRVRGVLVSDRKFREEYGVSADAVLSFDNGNVEFQRSVLFDAVRRSFDLATTVDDMRGQKWSIEFLGNEEPPKIALVQGEKRFVVAHLALLSQDRDMRLNSFRQEAIGTDLPSNAVERWGRLLESRPLDDDELGCIQDDLTNTPVAIQNAIRENLARGTLSLDNLVPRSEKYYERLVGRCEDEQTFEDFVKRVATPHMERLIKWRPFEGYQLSLLLASQPNLGAALGAIGLETTELARVYDWLTREGDVLSRAAAIEAGLLSVQAAPALKEPLSRLINALIATNRETQPDPYNLLSSIIVAVYGEIAHTRVLASKPPYWRRLAAIAQSVLIARCVTASRIDAAAFADWAMSVRGEIFLLQCFVDLRLEPRWLPELILPDQLKHELGGRILAAANAQATFVNEAGWYTLLLDDTNNSLRKQLNLSRAFLPGPLEGGMSPQLDVPPTHLAEMRSDLSQPAVTAASFSGLVNGSLLFRIPSELADMAADAIARADYQLECIGDTPLVPYLLGLASVASVARNHKLADSLFILLRKYRQFYPEELRVEESFRVAMIACASRVELSEWCKSVGNCMTDLAFQPIAKEQAIRLHSHVVHLCHIVPELWASCGQAEAALRSVSNI